MAQEVVIETPKNKKKLSVWGRIGLITGIVFVLGLIVLIIFVLLIDIIPEESIVFRVGKIVAIIVGFLVSLAFLAGIMLLTWNSIINHYATKYERSRQVFEASLWNLAPNQRWEHHEQRLRSFMRKVALWSIIAPILIILGLIIFGFLNSLCE